MKRNPSHSQLKSLQMRNRSLRQNGFISKITENLNNESQRSLESLSKHTDFSKFELDPSNTSQEAGLKLRSDFVQKKFLQRNQSVDLIKDFLSRNLTIPESKSGEKSIPSPEMERHKMEMKVYEKYLSQKQIKLLEKQKEFQSDSRPNLLEQPSLNHLLSRN